MSFPKRLKVYAEAWGRRSEHVFLISFCTQQLLHDARFPVLTLLITQTLSGGHATASVCSPLLKIMKFHAVSKLRRKY